EWVHVQLHQQKGMISLSPPTICNSAVRGQDGCSCRKMMRSVLWLIRRQDDLSTQSNNQHLFLPKRQQYTIRNNPPPFVLIMQ
ncbi:hypothetical protein ABXW41_27495, partial [Klebsiella pneumoniae]|uniref:hypothetical protein n=1 Tax=Klebsiella pneumoniae TaxID=573 RepID=UPI0033939A28